MFGEQWLEIVRRRQDAGAIVQPDRQVTFAELDALSRQISCPDEIWDAKGDAVTLAATLLAGFLQSQPVQVVEQDRVRRPSSLVIPEGTALIKQTVGASGVRRCQFFTLTQLQADVRRLHEAVNMADYDAIVAPISLAHSYGLTVALLQVLFHGHTLHWVPQPFPASVAEMLACSQRALLAGVPATWKAWGMAGIPMGNVACAISAGSPLTVNLERRIREQHQLKVRNLYGTSECGAVALDLSDDLRSSDSVVGTVLPGISVEPCRGRLLVKSDSVGIGYDFEQEDEVFGSGAHLTWDTGYVDGDQLFLTGCQGAGINVAGRKLSPAEVAEKIRLAVPGVELAISAGPSRDPERCQEVVVTVALPASALTPDFKTRACTHLAPWEVPRRWISTVP